MRHAKDDQSGVLSAEGSVSACMSETRERQRADLYNVADVGHSNEIVGQDHLGKVARVLVRLIDEVGEETLSGDLDRKGVSR